MRQIGCRDRLTPRVEKPSCKAVHTRAAKLRTRYLCRAHDFLDVDELNVCGTETIMQALQTPGTQLTQAVAEEGRRRKVGSLHAVLQNLPLNLVPHHNFPRQVFKLKLFERQRLGPAGLVHGCVC